MGHYVFMCSAQVESKTRLSRRQRRQHRTIECFGCKKEGHIVLTCPNYQAKPHCSGRTGRTSIENRSDWSINGLVPQEKIETSSMGYVASRTRQDLLKARKRQEKKRMSKLKGRICYTSRAKGHVSQDCLEGNKYEAKVVNSTSNVNGKSNGLYDTRKVISSLSTRAI
jgi:hypothetical protein